MRQGITVVGLLTLLVSCAPGPGPSAPAVEAAAGQEPASEPASVEGIWRLVETTGPDGTPTPPSGRVHSFHAEPLHGGV